MAIHYNRRPVVVFLNKSVTSLYYRQFLSRNFFNRAGHWHRQDYFQQDGATAHTADDSLLYLHGKVGQRMMSRRGRQMCEATLPDWPSRSPDLSPLDYWAWDRIKTGLHKAEGGWPKTEQRMRAAILEVVETISQTELNKAILSFKNKIESCYAAEGGHFEYKD